MADSTYSEFCDLSLSVQRICVNEILIVTKHCQKAGNTGYVQVVQVASTLRN